MFTRKARVAICVVALAVTAAPLSGTTVDAATCGPDSKTANLNFTFKDLDGRDVTLSAFKGKVILLDFWATWCGAVQVRDPRPSSSCTRNIARRAFRSLAWRWTTRSRALKEYAQQMKMNYPVLVGEGREDILEAFGPMPGLPTTFIIDREGKICKSHTGFEKKETFEQEIKSLL